VLPLVHQATGLPLDIVLAGPGLEDEFLARAVLHQVDDVEVVEVSVLVILKVLAGRPRSSRRVPARGCEPARPGRYCRSRRQQQVGTFPSRIAAP